MIETLSRTRSTSPQEQTAIDHEFLRIIAPIAEEATFKKILEEEQTFLQKTATATNDIVAPANVIDAVGLFMAIDGMNHLDSWSGILKAAIGFGVDVVDGKIARVTNTQSTLGEAVDAAGDKVKLAYALYKIWQLDLAPKSLIKAVAIQNGLNVTLTAIDQKLNKTPAIHSSKNGKHAIFLQQMGLGLHVIANEVGKTNERRGKVLRVGGSALGAAGVGLGGVATYGYGKTLVQSIRKK